MNVWKSLRNRHEALSHTAELLNEVRSSANDGSHHELARSVETRGTSSAT